MWIAPYKHPLFKSDQQEKFRNRWTVTPQGTETEFHKLVHNRILDGAGNISSTMIFTKGICQ
jgi:hypothetical protein